MTRNLDGLGHKGLADCTDARFGGNVAADVVTTYEGNGAVGGTAMIPLPRVLPRMLGPVEYHDLSIPLPYKRRFDWVF